MSVSRKSLMLVFLQLVLLAGLALSGPWWPTGAMSRVWIAGGIALGVWSLATLGLRHLRATPEPAAGARLIVTGPYRWMRHPMYTATLVVVTGWLIGYATWPRGLLALLLLVVLLVKLRFEERLLARHFPEYAAYTERTKRLVPWVW